MHRIQKILVIVLLLAGMIFGAAVYISKDHLRAAMAPQAETIPAATQAETTPETETVPTEPTETQEAVPTETTQPVPTEERFRLTFVGDCTLGCSPTNYHAEVGFVKTVGEDYAYPFRNVISWFEGDDATFANLEGPLTDEGGPAVKKHTFRGPESYVNILTENSVEFVSLANNHTLDYGQTGYDNTLKTLNAAGVPYVERDASCLITLDSGLKVGVYGVVYYAFDLQDMEQEIHALREQGAEVVIVAAHWGTEGGYKPTSQQQTVGRAAIEAGADIVWGTHPHVLQPIEEYNGGIIYYSLGNFSFGGNTSPRDLDSALVSQEVIRSPEGQIRLGECTVIPVCVSSVETGNNFQPTPYEEGTRPYERVLEKLSGTYTGPDLA